MRTMLRRPVLRGLLLSAIVLIPVMRARAQDSVAARLPGATPPMVNVQATRITTAIDLDGRLDEAAWASAPAVEGFRQKEPREGSPSTMRTVVRVVYDDDALYVGAKLYDPAPDSIIARLGRRDNDGGSDAFMVGIDPFHDRRSGYFFGVNAAGVLVDGTMSNDSWMDDSWDGVWAGRTVRDAEGWTVEIKIPYSQIRFPKAEVQTWGINFARMIPRRQEEAFLRVVPSSENAFVSYFADLTGLERIQPSRGMEIVPYVTSQAALTSAAPGNPFNDGSDFKLSAGADFKLGVTPNLTLSATVNPDFGQVEVDPAVVNLSGFETFFPERRPFFVEGSSNYDFGNGGSGRNIGFNWVGHELFYSRRIGRSPQGSLPQNEFSDYPSSARILGAAKLTGRVGQTNVGVLSSVTERTVAQIQAAGARHGVEVEPVTHYGVARAQREFSGGKQGLGFIGTATNRFFNDDRLRDQINEAAYVGGVDGWVQVFGGNMVLKGWGAVSSVNGTAARMAALQQSSVHYMQRPDRKVARFDPTRTALTGFMTRIALDQLKGNTMVNAAFGAVSPTFDLNDLGFIGRTDLINAHLMAGQFFPRPTGIFQRRWMGAAVFGTWNFDGDRTGTGAFMRTENTFRNFWELNSTLFVVVSSYSPNLTRGGPVARSPGGVEFNISPETDGRKVWSADADFGGFFGPRERSRYASFGINWQPGTNVRVSMGPSLSRSTNEAQYVRRQLDATAALDAPLGASVPKARYVFGTINQWEVASNVRVNWTFSPTMSLQLFAQPLLSTGDYGDYKELARARSGDFNRYAETGTVTEANNRVTVDPDGPGAAPSFSFNNPDFRFISLRGNAVFRWEYRPGSTLFLVWTQQADDFEQTGTFAVGRPVGRLFDERPDNVFAVKLTYWLGR
jgi:hypothetical protein